MSKSKSKKRQRSTPWWRSSRAWDRMALALFGLVVVAAAGGVIWLAIQGAQGGDRPIKTGQSVEAFTLPDIVSGKRVLLADYLGKQDIVIVGYMGFF